jgi:hypothetical protein
MRLRLSIIILALTIFSASLAPVYADHDETAGASTSARKTIEYAMPYPGLLPDSPFYSIKMVRDRFVEFLISDPLKQAEFDLLQADKRMQAGIYLMNKDTKKANLSLSTIAKGQQYFKKSLTDAAQAKKQGHPIKTFSSKLHLSAQKHAELLHSIEKKIPANEVGYYKKITAETTKLTQEASALDAKEHPKN